eukprot:m.274835 g.274835  ORF g.274835 m.274835 type:complete len:191 (+) comp17692_c0_seq15:1170-1742(+)
MSESQPTRLSFKPACQLPSLSQVYTHNLSTAIMEVNSSAWQTSDEAEIFSQRLNKLTKQLLLQFNASLGSPMIYQLVEDAKAWLAPQHAAKDADTLVLTVQPVAAVKVNDPQTKTKLVVNPTVGKRPPGNGQSKQGAAYAKATASIAGLPSKHGVVMQEQEDGLSPEQTLQRIEESTVEAASIAQERGSL